VFVEPQNGCEKDITEEKIINYLKNSVAKYAVPKVVKIVESIPLTEVQKVNKKLLRQIAEKEFSGKNADGASS
jgi:acyl-coenzyme A synthetase/AMP-(fatty) acid ligase